MMIKKFKRRATLMTSTGGRLDVNIFLSHSTETHLGEELFLDVLNSDKQFVPMEDTLANEILLIGKTQIMGLELSERNLMTETLDGLAIPVQVELVNGEVLEGNFFTEMPPYQSRLSDYLNHTPQFVYLCRQKNDFILNKAYILTAKQK